MSEDLERLKRALHPDEKMDIIEQCRIVAEALSPTGEFPNNKRKLGEYLEVSENKLYKMEVVHVKMIPSAKEWFRTSNYQVNTAYNIAVLSPEIQLERIQKVLKMEETK
jgi:hypothetical protein